MNHNHTARRNLIVRKHMLKVISALAVSALMLPSVISPAKAYAAEEATPTVVFSTIEGEGVEITIPNVISKDAERTWYCNDEVLALDENHIDTSEGTTAKLKLTETSTRNHMDDYKCISSGAATTKDFAKLYVISKDNYYEADLTIKDMEATIGSDLYAKDLTVYIDKTPYPNFAPLQFVENGVLQDKIRVKNGTYTYNLIDTVYGRNMEVVITGVGDEIAPSIKYFGVKDKMADKYATEKTVEVAASDNESGLPEDAYYFEQDDMLSSVLKMLVLDGATADSLNGITWSKEKEYTVTDNGVYTIFVRDKAGNLAYKDLNISKISTHAPYITDTFLGKDDGKAYFTVSAKDLDNQPLQYRLNGGKWQESEKLFGVKEGENVIEVKNEAGVTASTTRTVYLSIFLGTEDGFSEESLYNYISVSPSTWTNKQVTVSLVLPDSLTSKLTASPYSVNGAAFSSSRSKTVSSNGETVQFTVKDLYGNTHTSEVYTVGNIDKEKPYLEVLSGDDTFTIKAGDSGSGIEKITVTSTSASNYVIKANGSAGTGSDTVTYKAPSNGTYTFTVYDFAGNSATATGSMTYFTEENGTAQTALKNSGGNISSLYAGKGNGASVLGTKKAAEIKSGSGEKLSVSTSLDEVLLEDDARIYSDAGHSVSPDLDDAEKLDIIREQDVALASSPKMIEKQEIYSENGKLLKGLFIFLLGVVVISAIVVVCVNSEKKKERDDFSFRK